jgi:hypothetical protein
MAPAIGVVGLLLPEQVGGVAQGSFEKIESESERSRMSNRDIRFVVPHIARLMRATC